MNPMNPLMCASTLTLALIGAPGMAQTPGAAPDPAKAVETNTAFPATQGSVARFLLNPNGEVDGLLLKDGGQIKFPPHMANELTAAVKLGDAVSAQGIQEYQGKFKAVAITNTGTGQTIVEHAPAPDAARVPKHLRGANLSPLSAEGKVEYLQHGKRGEINGVILDNGSIIRFPREAASQFPALMQVGQAISVTGYGTENQYGRALEATALGASGQALQPIYDHGPRGPGHIKDRDPRLLNPAAAAAPAPGPAAPAATVR